MTVTNIMETLQSSIYFIFLLLGISPSPSLHLSLILFVALQVDFQRLRDRVKIDTLLLEPLESFRSSRFGSIDAEDFDAMAG